MKLRLSTIAFAVLLTAATALAHGSADMAAVPGGVYRPLARSVNEPAEVPVAAFLLDVAPATNGDYLAFVTANPKWRRSEVSRLFADESYLDHWASDLEPGPKAPLDAPVVRVSWFAARAYARWVGKRLPTLAEWEHAAAAGYATARGADEPDFVRDLYAWLGQPVPAVQSSVSAVRANVHGIRGLHGLVWEWVDDFNSVLVNGESRADSELDRDLFCGAAAAGARDTSDYAAFMRQGLRSSLRAKLTTTSLGFRCARDLPEPFDLRLP
jgi:formylglycine-generating enzyme required for sulfatase activity